MEMIDAPKRGQRQSIQEVQHLNNGNGKIRELCLDGRILLRNTRNVWGLNRISI